MSYTLRDLIEDAAREIGAIDAIDPIEEDDAAVGLRVVRLMMDTNQADRLLLFTRDIVPKVLTPGVQTQTIGKAGQIDTVKTPRPVFISGIGVIPVGDTFEIPLDPYSQDEWREERLKTFTDAYPRRYVYDANWVPGTALGAITWWPSPTTAATVKIYIPQPLISLATLDDAGALQTVIDFPPGYGEFNKYSLARRLCGPYRKSLSAEQKDLLREARGLILRANDPGPQQAATDPTGSARGGYDIRTNTYR